MDGENPEATASTNASHLTTPVMSQEDFEIVPPPTSSLYAAMEEINYSEPLTTHTTEEIKLDTKEMPCPESKATSDSTCICRSVGCQCPDTGASSNDCRDGLHECTMSTTTTAPVSGPEPGVSQKVEDLGPCISDKDRTAEEDAKAEASTQTSTVDNDDDLPPPYPPPPPPTLSPSSDMKLAEDIKYADTKLAGNTKSADDTKSADSTKPADDTKLAGSNKYADDTKSADTTKSADDTKSVDTTKSTSETQRDSNTEPAERIRSEKDHIDVYYDKLPWALGAIGRLLGLEFAPINIPLSRRLQTFAVLFWMSCFLFMGFGAFFTLLYMFFYTQYWWISLAYFTWFLGDKSISSRGGRRWRWVRGWALWRHYRDFFPIEVVKTADLDLAKNYIMGYHPHGVLCAGAFSLFATEGSGFSKLFPRFKPYLLTLGGHFLLPIYREFFMSTGAVSATRESMDYLLGREGSGRALCLVVGGAKEALDCHPGALTLHLSKRKGFCKMAIRHGASLVPMFSFGENEIYDQVPNPPGSWIRWFQDTLQKVLGIAPCLFMGRGVFQYSFGIVPFRKPIKIVIGKPIDVPQERKPTRKQIEDLHAEYVAALKKLYEDNKEKYSMFPDRKLIII